MLKAFALATLLTFPPAAGAASPPSTNITNSEEWPQSSSSSWKDVLTELRQIRDFQAVLESNRLGGQVRKEGDILFLIVGGGPAGLLTAFNLRFEHGVPLSRIQILEKRKSYTRRNLLVIQPRTLGSLLTDLRQVLLNKQLGDLIGNENNVLYAVHKFESFLRATLEMTKQLDDPGSKHELFVENEALGMCTGAGIDKPFLVSTPDELGKEDSYDYNEREEKVRNACQQLKGSWLERASDAIKQENQKELDDMHWHQRLLFVGKRLLFQTPANVNVTLDGKTPLIRRDFRFLISANGASTSVELNRFDGNGNKLEAESGILDFNELQVKLKGEMTWVDKAFYGMNFEWQQKNSVKLTPHSTVAMFLRQDVKDSCRFNSNHRGYSSAFMFAAPGNDNYHYVLHHTPEDKDHYVENSGNQRSFQQELVNNVESSKPVKAIMGKSVFFRNSIEVSDKDHTYQPIHCDEGSRSNTEIYVNNHFLPATMHRKKICSYILRVGDANATPYYVLGEGISNIQTALDMDSHKNFIREALKNIDSESFFNEDVEDLAQTARFSRNVWNKNKLRTRMSYVYSESFRIWKEKNNPDLSKFDNQNLSGAMDVVIDRKMRFFN